MLEIIKKDELIFWHIDSQKGAFTLGKYSFSIDDDFFQVIEEGHAKRKQYHLSEIIIYDDTSGSVPETFTNSIAFVSRLRDLGYRGFDLNNVAISITHNKGFWNASTNTPLLSNATGKKGDYYTVSLAGTFQGESFKAGDRIEHNGAAWFKAVNNNQAPDLSPVVKYIDIVNNLTAGGANVPASAETVKVLKGYIDNINTLLGSNDVNLDTLQEIVTFIKSIDLELDNLLVNDLTTGGITKALTAEQGKQLFQMHNYLVSNLGNNYYTKAEINAKGRVYHINFNDVIPFQANTNYSIMWASLGIWYWGFGTGSQNGQNRASMARSGARSVPFKCKLKSINARLAHANNVTQGVEIIVQKFTQGQASPINVVDLAVLDLTTGFFLSTSSGSNASIPSNLISLNTSQQVQANEAITIIARNKTGTAAFSCAVDILIELEEIV